MTASYLASSDRGTALATALIALAAIGFGMVPYFAKSLTDSGMSPAAIAFYRYALAAVALLPFLALRRADLRTTLWGIVAGAAIGLGWVGYVAALKTVPVATAGVLYMTYPVFTIAIAWAGFRVVPTIRALIAAMMILVAAAVVLSPGAVSIGQLPAALIALGAPIGFGFGINVLTHKLIRIAVLSRIAAISLGALIGLTPVLAQLDFASILPASTGDWWLIGGIAVVTAIVPQLIYTVFAPRIGAARSAIAGSFELPAMFFIAWAALDEVILPVHFLAAALVLTAIAITPSRPARTVFPASPPDAARQAASSHWKDRP